MATPLYSVQCYFDILIFQELLHANYKLPFANILLDDFDLIFLTFVSLISLKLRISQHPPML